MTRKVSLTVTKPQGVNPEAIKRATKFAKESGKVGTGRKPPAGHRRLVINLPDHLHRKLMHAAIDRDTTATAILAEYIERL